MPIYNHRCNNNHVFEKALPVEERDQLLWCPICQADGLPYVPVERLQAAPGFAVHGFNSKNGYSR